MDNIIFNEIKGEWTHYVPLQSKEERLSIGWPIFAVSSYSISSIPGIYSAQITNTRIWVRDQWQSEKREKWRGKLQSPLILRNRKLRALRLYQTIRAQEKTYDAQDNTSYNISEILSRHECTSNWKTDFVSSHKIAPPPSMCPYH